LTGAQLCALMPQLPKLKQHAWALLAVASNIAATPTLATTSFFMGCPFA